MINHHPLYIIVATDHNLGIGKNGKMPWGFQKEMKHFREVTMATQNPAKQNMVLMGRTTWESIPEAHRPLKNRKNVVLTRTPDFHAEGAETALSLDKALQRADESIESIFIIGGGKVYAEALTLASLDGIYLTRIDKIYECDTYFPVIPEVFSDKEKLGGDSEDGVDFEYLLYRRA